MGMIHAFRKLAYAQVVLGVIAYAVAEQNAVMVLAVGTLGTLSWYIVEGPGGRPLPRWFINLGVITATVWLFYAQVVLRQPLIVGLGQFIVALTLFKLYEKKHNRDWSQMIVLSLMQVTCASIISAEVVYGVLLAVYMVLALITLLQFQLKRGYDEVAEATARQTPPDQRPVRPKPTVTRGHRRHFNMLAIISGIGLLAAASTVFILVPRGAGAGILGDWDTPVQRPVSGFSRKVELDGGHTVATSRLPVMNVALELDDKPFGNDAISLLMRGLALDSYNPRTHRWTRSSSAAAADRSLAIEDAPSIDAPIPLVSPAAVDAGLTQHVTVRSQTDGVLFSVYPPVAVHNESGNELVFNPRDQVIAARTGSPKSAKYTVLSPGSVVAPGAQGLALTDDAHLARFPDGPTVAPGRSKPRRFDWATYARGPVLKDPRLARRARSIYEPHGLHRNPAAESTASDHAIAGHIETYLQSHFVYTLELPEVPEGSDPIQGFLFAHQSGHCEYFASAMTSMLRGVGIRSRVVTGFRATEFNAVGGYYVVRQKNAHAWVEVWQDGTGWRVFDPSPPAVIEQVHQPESGFFAWLRDLYEYIEFEWINNVISYDDNTRQNVMVSLDTKLDAITDWLNDKWVALAEWAAAFEQRWLQGPWGYVLLGLVGAMIATGIYLLGRILVRRMRHIRQLQLEAVGGRHKRRLARELAFYLEMLRIVERDGHAKPTWQTPASFAEALIARDGARFADVRPLTDVFYQIRFGNRPMDTARKKIVAEHLDRLHQLLRGATDKAAATVKSE